MTRVKLIVFDAFPHSVSILLQALESLLPPKKPELSPLPDTVDEVKYEEADIVDVRARSFPAGADFLNQSFSFSQFGENDEDAWIDDDDEGMHGDEDDMEPDCRHQ